VSLVVDASIAAAWVLPDEQNEAADAVMTRLAGITARVPTLFWHELRNILLMAERRGRLPVGGAEANVLRLRRLPIEEAGAGGDATVLALATRHRLTAYDAAYLALAVNDGLPLATTDRALAEACRREAVPLLGPLGAP
jgi:predicted nucleic acid-binding protein